MCTSLEAMPSFAATCDTNHESTASAFNGGVTNSGASPSSEAVARHSATTLSVPSRNFWREARR